MLLVHILLLLVPLILSNPIHSKQTRYDELEARKLLNLAAAAYGTEHDQCLNKTFPGHEDHQLLTTIKEECDHLDNTCESYIVVSEKLNQLTIVFRGTKTKKQLLLEGWDSIQPGADFFDMGKVNRYFLNAHLILWPKVQETLTDPKYENYQVTFTGHSLGGALASLAAARTVKQGFRRGDQIKIITFGQPRVGTLEFANNFDEIITYSFRVVFRRDIVPHLPTCQMVEDGEVGNGDSDSKPCNGTALHKSYHHGTEIWYPDSMEVGSNYLECTGLPKNEDFKCSDRIKFRYDQTSSYIWDHRHYFGVRVPEYGKVGCDASKPEGKPGVFEQVMCWLSPSPNCEEHVLEREDELMVVPLEVILATEAPVSTTTPMSKSSIWQLILSPVLYVFGRRNL